MFTANTSGGETAPFGNEESNKEDNAIQEGVPSVPRQAKGPIQVQAGHKSGNEWDDMEAGQDKNIESNNNDIENG